MLFFGVRMQKQQTKRRSENLLNFIVELTHKENIQSMNICISNKKSFAA